MHVENFEENEIVFILAKLDYLVKADKWHKLTHLAALHKSAWWSTDSVHLSKLMKVGLLETHITFIKADHLHWGSDSEGYKNIFESFPKALERCPSLSQ